MICSSTKISTVNMQKELKKNILQEICCRLQIAAKKNNDKILYGMVNKIVRESQKLFPFITRSVINKSYKKYVPGNCVSGFAQIKSHPISRDESKEKRASAGKESSSSRGEAEALRGRVLPQIFRKLNGNYS